MAIAVMNWVLEEAPDLPAHCFGVLMALASKAREDGTGSRPGQEWLAGRARKSDRSVRSDLATLEALGLIRRGDQSLVVHIAADERPVVWDLAVELKRDRKQPSARTEDSVDADQEQEERGRKSASGRKQTSARKHTSGGERKQASGDTSGDTSTSPPSGESARTHADTREARSKSSRKARRGTRIPDDFASTITTEMVAWARAKCPNVNGRDQTERFVDYWSDKTGKDATKIDWVGTWRNWMRREQDKFGPAPNGRASPSSANGTAGARTTPPTAEEIDAMDLKGKV